jgi:L-lysine exporter family protein LysE/ArgO
MIAYLPSFAAGFLLGGTLIIAIGAQNAFILRMGLIRNHVFILCFVCALSDALLIVAGIAGMGAFVRDNPLLLRAIALAGAAFLFAYAAFSLRRAMAPVAMQLEGISRPPLRAALLQCLAFTFLNPHVYLDTVVLVGAYSTAHAGAAKVAFGLGAAAASFAWFFALGYGARLLAPLFSRPSAWRILDGGIAIVMTGLALALLRDAVQ